MIEVVAGDRDGGEILLRHWREYVDVALESFGVDRLMFGSDYPVCLLAASYDRELDSFQEILKRLTDADREKILSTNAARFYRV